MGGSTDRVVLNQAPAGMTCELRSGSECIERGLCMLRKNVDVVASDSSLHLTAGLNPSSPLSHHPSLHLPLPPLPKSR